MVCSKEIILEKKEAIFSVKQQLLLTFLKVAFAIYFHHAGAKWSDLEFLCNHHGFLMPLGHI